MSPPFAASCVRLVSFVCNFCGLGFLLVEDRLSTVHLCLPGYFRRRIAREFEFLYVVVVVVYVTPVHQRSSNPVVLLLLLLLLWLQS